jgi:hypothetical protein
MSGGSLGGTVCRPGLGEIAVIVPGERVQQGHALQAKKIGQRVLIDHPHMLGASLLSVPQRRSPGATDGSHSLHGPPNQCSPMINL